MDDLDDKNLLGLNYKDTPQVDKEIQQVVEDTRVIKFDMEIFKAANNIKDINTGDINLMLSEEQINYLDHWNVQQKLKELFPLNIYEFNLIAERATAFSRDPAYFLQWHMDTINAPDALNTTGQETKNIVVAVIDSGSPSTSSTAWAQSAFISGGYDFSNNSGGIDSDPTDPEAAASNFNITSHGTHVGTTIAALNNGVGLNGFGLKVLPIKVFSPSGGGDIAALTNAIKYASGENNISGSVAPSGEGPVRVINMSIQAYWGSCPSSLQNAINIATAKGITVVAAAGNKYSTAVSFPGGCDNVISVGATNPLDTRSVYSQQNATVDIAAPGGGINESVDGINAFTSDVHVKAISGTSMASPIVSGVIGNLYSLDSTLTPSDINTYLVGGYLSNDIGSSGKDNQYGYGLIDMSKAAQSIIAGEGLSNTFAFSYPGTINFGYSTTQINVGLFKVGSGSLSFSSIAADNGTGFSQTNNVNSDGYGVYTLSIDRSSLPNGSFSNTLYFTMSDGSVVTSNMNYSKGSERSRPDLGKVWVILYNSSGTKITQGQLDMNSNGSLGFSVSNLPIGSYYYLVSTDIDNDGFVCTVGEICEYYPLESDINSFINLSDSNISGESIQLKVQSAVSRASLSSATPYFSLNPLISY